MATFPGNKAPLGGLSGDSGRDLKAIKAEIRAIEREIQLVAKAGGKVDAEQLARLKRAQVAQTTLRERGAMFQNIDRAEKAAKFFRGLDKIQSVQTIAREGVSVRSVAELISDNKIERAMEKIGAKRLGAAIGAIAPVVGLGLFAYDQIKGMMEQIDAEKKDANSIGRRYGSGQISKAEYDFFQARQNAGLAHTGKPLDSFNNAEKQRVALHPFQTMSVINFSASNTRR
jgi:hypothetical protein